MCQWILRPYTVCSIAADSNQIWICYEFTPKLGQSPCSIVQGHWPNFVKNEWERISIFIIYTDTYACSYVV